MKAWSDSDGWIDIDVVYAGRGPIPGINPEGWRQIGPPQMLAYAPSKLDWPADRETVKAPDSHAARPKRQHRPSTKPQKHCACGKVIHQSSTYCVPCYMKVRNPPVFKQARCACGRPKASKKPVCDRCRFKARAA